MRITQKGLEIRIIGEPELRYTKDGMAIWKARAKVSKRMKTRKGWEDDPNYGKVWVSVVAFGDLAEDLADRDIEPGNILVVREGRIDPERGRDGLAIIAESLTVASAKSSGKSSRKGIREDSRPKRTKGRRAEDDEEEEEVEEEVEEEEERPTRRRRSYRREEEEFPDESELPF